MAWYNVGARVLDLSGLTGVTIGGTQISGEGVREIGSARFPGGEARAAKTPRINGRGDFYLYSNDIERGLDIWQFRGEAKKVKKGKWMNGAQAQSFFASNPVKLADGYELFCLTGGNR